MRQVDSSHTNLLQPQKGFEAASGAIGFQLPAKEQRGYPSKSSRLPKIGTLPLPRQIPPSCRLGNLDCLLLVEHVSQMAPVLSMFFSFMARSGFQFPGVTHTARIENTVRRSLPNTTYAFSSPHVLITRRGATLSRLLSLGGRLADENLNDHRGCPPKILKFLNNFQRTRPLNP